MCTIGALHVSNDEYFLFKNKDFSRPEYIDRIKKTDLLWGAEGLETFSADPSVEDVYSGLSVGTNRYGLLAADSHVKITDSNASNYDILVETALSQSRNIETALSALSKRIAAHPSWWGNLVLADATGIVAVEVRDSILKIERNSSKIIRTNHQHLHGTDDGIENNTSNSYGRFEWASEKLAQPHNVDSLKAMLGSHDTSTSQGTHTGICNHTYSQTVCSYILHFKQGITTLHFLQGQPCLSEHYTEQKLFAS
ncbi:MAG: carcinine hydrolase/isopenicillin-N N-acyltransferase family protein [Halopseudomonas aestusnigri]